MKKRFIVFILACVLVISFTGGVLGAEYYVDYETGSDSNDGLSTTTAWKHCPGDQDALGNAAITLSAGDTVVFKGGVIYAFDGTGNNYIALTASGTSGNRITYISGHVHASSWGTGRAKFDCTNATPDAASKDGVLELSNSRYITIQGIEMYNMKENSSYRGFIGWADHNTSTDAQLIIDDVLLHHGNANGIMIVGRYTLGTRASNFIIRNSTIYDTWAGGISIRWGISDLLIENNDIDQAGADPYPDDAGTPAANPIGLTFGGYNSQLDITIRGNNIGDSTGTGNKGFILVQNIIENLTIEDNYFHGFPNIGSPHFTSPVTNLIIRNNVFNVQPITHEGILRFYSDQANGNINGLKIYNNTFVCKTQRTSGIIYFKAGSDQDVQYTNVDIHNNIIDTDNTTNQFLIYIGNTIDGSNKPVVDIATFTSDYNVYKWVPLYNPFYFDNAARTMSYWQSTLGLDTFSYVQNLDPLFVDATNPLGPDGILWTDDDGFRPQANSPVCGAGEGGSDVGAYECLSSPSTCSSADTNQNNIVEITELINYISKWKLGTVVIGDLITAIGEWKNGCS